MFSQGKKLSFIRRVDHSIFDKRVGIFASFRLFDQVCGKIKAGDLCAKGGEAAGGQPVAAGDIQDVLPGSGRQQRGKRGPAQKIQDVYKKPYIFRLTFPTKLANFKKALLFPKVSLAF